MDGFEGCPGDVDPSCRCWMDVFRRKGGVVGEEDEDEDEEIREGEEGRRKEFESLKVPLPDGKVSFLDNKDGILDVGRRAESAVYMVLRGPDGYPSPEGDGLHGNPGLMGSMKFDDREAGRTRPVYTSYFARE
ncbi:hypothetical protein TWF506_009778 [Arthrobotrys conoides]|uniref:Uncharacterized protein n=1 Tax=Arthrobotrys conoides TaxID=74498 RepID=A0AAN8NJ94_9PEZI